MTTETIFDVRVPGDELTDDLRELIEANATSLGVDSPLVFAANGDWLALAATNRRKAASLRRELNGLGLSASIEASGADSTHDSTVSAPAASERDSASVVAADPEATIEASSADFLASAFGSESDDGFDVFDSTSDELGLLSPDMDNADALELELEVEAIGAGEADVLDWFGGDDDILAQEPSTSTSSSSATDALSAAPRLVTPVRTPSRETAAEAPRPSAAMRGATAPRAGGAPPMPKPADFGLGAPAPPRARPRAARAPKKSDEEQSSQLRENLIFGAVMVGGVVVLLALYFLLFAAPEPKPTPVRERETEAKAGVTLEAGKGVAGYQPGVEPLARVQPTVVRAAVEPEESGPVSDVSPEDQQAARDLLEEGMAKCAIEKFEECETTMEAVIMLDPGVDEAYVWIVKARAGIEARDNPQEELVIPETTEPKEPTLIVATPDSYEERRRQREEEERKKAAGDASKDKGKDDLDEKDRPIPPGVTVTPVENEVDATDTAKDGTKDSGSGPTEGGADPVAPDDDAPAPTLPPGTLPSSPEELRKLQGG